MTLNFTLYILFLNIWQLHLWNDRLWKKLEKIVTSTCQDIMSQWMARKKCYPQLCFTVMFYCKLRSDLSTHHGLIFMNDRLVIPIHFEKMVYSNSWLSSKYREMQRASKMCRLLAGNHNTHPEIGCNKLMVCHKFQHKNRREPLVCSDEQIMNPVLVLHRQLQPWSCKILQY